MIARTLSSNEKINNHDNVQWKTRVPVGSYITQRGMILHIRGTEAYVNFTQNATLNMCNSCRVLKVLEGHVQIEIPR